jgi:hypothetical protein
MTTALELYEVNLVSSSKLKLRATARLAEGTEESIFDACVLFHTAARFERRAVDALSPCPPATRLAGSIEDCWCLIEGRSPDAAAEVWSRILEEAQAVDAVTAEAMLSRLRPRYDAAIREFVQVFATHPTLNRPGLVQDLVPASRKERESALREVQAVLKVFPGVPEFWWASYRLSTAGEMPAQAWAAIARAQALVPDDARYRAMSLIAAAEALPPADADRHLAEAFANLQQSGAEVALMYAYSEILLAQKRAPGREKRWARALRAVEEASSRTRSVWLLKNLRGVRLYLEAAMAKRKVDRDLLYHAGLGRLAATSGKNPIDTLRADATARVGAMDGSEAAA